MAVNPFFKGKLSQDLFSLDVISNLQYNILLYELWEFILLVIFILFIDLFFQRAPI